MELIYQDIRGERAVPDDLRKQIADELREVGKKFADVDKKVGDLDKQKQTVTKDITDLQKRQTELEATERKNIAQIAKVYESMAPESAARIIQQMADSGRLDTAVKVLSQMRERQAAGILDQITDAGLAGQLTERLRGVKRTPAVSGVSAVAPPGP
jgi:flagellar motility protein MotE (MotC chaperone)